jgi:hypothetical protein
MLLLLFQSGTHTVGSDWRGGDSDSGILSSHIRTLIGHDHDLRDDKYTKTMFNRSFQRTRRTLTHADVFRVEHHSIMEKKPHSFSS